MTAPERALLEAAASRYRAAGRYALHFARGKLRHDPVFLALLRRALIPDRARLLDLGCGQCLLASLLGCAPRLHDAGQWPPGWPPPPRGVRVHGIDLLARDVRRAQRALGDALTVEAADIRDAAFPAADVVVVLDVLHYLPPADQDAILHRISQALAPGGRLLLRVADPAAGMRFWWTWFGDRFGTLMRAELWPRHHHRALPAWRAALQALGLRVAQLPMSEGTPFANVLLIADKTHTVGAAASHRP